MSADGRTPRGSARLASLVLAGLALAGCSGSSSSGGITDDCSTAAQNQAVYATMQHWYLWYAQLPTVNPASFASPDALLEALRVNPPDRFSYLTTQAEEDALFGASQFVGLGFRSLQQGAELWVTDVFEGGPAATAGLLRGSRILAVDGVDIATVLAAPGGLTAALGPAEVGYTLALSFTVPGEQDPLTRSLQKAVVTIPPVTGTRVFELDGTPTGYLVLRNFVTPGVAALDQAFAEFAAAGVTQLIVDVRYNGGGLVRVLEHLANLVASRTAPGLPFASYRYNDKNSARDETFLFATEPPPNALQLQKVVFITTGSTASASEMLVNGIQPWLPTAVVGSETFGKPVGQDGFRFCGRVLRPVTFATVNGVGSGDFFDGIPVDCPADDTLAVGFGVPGEASFDAAVQWLRFGFCPDATPLERAERQLAAPATRWQLNDAH